MRKRRKRLDRDGRPVEKVCVALVWEGESERKTVEVVENCWLQLENALRRTVESTGAGTHEAQKNRCSARPSVLLK